MRWAIGTKIGAGYALALAALIIIGAASYSSVENFLRTYSLVDHSYQVLVNVEKVSADLLQIETGQRGYAITGDESFLAPYNQGLAQVTVHLQDLVKLTEGTPSQSQLLTTLKPLVEARCNFARQVVNLQRQNKHDAAIALIKRGEGKQIHTQLAQTLDSLRSAERALLKQRRAESEANARTTVLVVVVGVSIACLLLLVAGIVITRGIARPLQRLTGAASQIASGDLDVQTGDVHRRDEIGDLGRAFERMSRSLQQMAHGATQVASGNLAVAIKPQSEKDVVGNALAGMVNNLSTLIGQVQRAGIQVNASSTQIAATAREQQATANEVLSTTTEIGATSREISTTSKELVNSMRRVTEVAEGTAALADSGQTGLSQMEATMRQIVEASGSIHEKLAVLNERAGSINTVVTTITKVADQTNLLSLNAAIEAEKAGEHGRGFAVVATEIRRLADQTAGATSDIEQMVKEMQSAVSAGVMGMDKFSEEVRRGVDEVRQVSAQLGQIIQQVQALTPNFEEVNDGMQSQSLAAEQISEALSQLTEAVQQTVESLVQSNAAIEHLNDATQGLHKGIDRFSLPAKE